MTDPADMDGAALGEAVGLAMGWVCTERIDGGVSYPWVSPDGMGQHPLDFTGPGKWAAFGEVLAHVYALSGVVEIREQYSEERRWVVVVCDTHFAIKEQAAAGPGDIPRALAVAFLRAVAGEGRA